MIPGVFGVMDKKSEVLASIPQLLFDHIVIFVVGRCGADLLRERIDCGALG